MKALSGALLAAFALSSAIAETPLVLKAGTPVPLATRVEVSSKTHRQGDRFALEVTDPVTVGGHVVIPRGSPATGEVARHRGVGAFGRGGRLQLTLLYVTVDGRNIRLTGQETGQGKDAAVPAYAAGMVVAGALGAAIKGKDAFIPVGTPMTGFVYRDLPLAVASR